MKAKFIYFFVVVSLVFLFFRIHSIFDDLVLKYDRGIDLLRVKFVVQLLKRELSCFKTYTFKQICRDYVSDNK